MAELIDLKVGIFPRIPDLDRDSLKGLREFVKCEFEAEHPDISLTISTDWDPYDTDKVSKTYLSPSETSFDILEIDTVLLGEVAEQDILQYLQPEKYNLREDYFDIGIDAVTYNGYCYGIPTLHCANFLIELISDEAEGHERILRSLETQRDHDFKNIKEIVEKYNKLFSGVSPLVGYFRGKWALPCFYLDAFIDKHGAESVQKGVYSLIDDEPDVLDAMKWLMKLDEGADGINKGISEKYASPDERNSDIAISDHILLYGYSEWLSQIMSDKMCKKRNIHATCIISPPLGAENNLLTFTNALIVSKSSYSSDDRRAEAIDRFIQFYTSLSFRNKYAAGADLKDPHPPRYLIVARKDFYTDGFGAQQKNYQKLYEAMYHSVAAPNYGLASRHEEMNRVLGEKLGLPKVAS